MVKPLVNPIIFWPIVGVIIVLIFVVGLATSQQCIDISGCKTCWSTIDRTEKSEACPANQTCTVEAYVDQHNAVTSALICACEKARSGVDYPNSDLNKKIVDEYGKIYGSSPSVQEVCES